MSRRSAQEAPEAVPPASGARGTLPERLLTEAIRLFAEKGFEGTTVQEVVAAAGVTKGAMYHYFSSKDDLLYAIYHRLLGLQSERLDAIADGPGTPTERVRAAAADVVETTLSAIEEAIVFFRSMHMLPADKQAKVRAERRRYHERFRDLVDEGRAAGEFRADVPSDIVVHYYFGAVNHLGMWYHSDGKLNPPEVGAYYADMFMQGLVR